MRDADATRVTAIFERNAAGDRDRVFTKATMNRDLAPAAFRGCSYIIDYRKQRIWWTSRDRRGLAHRSARPDEEIERVIVGGERCDFGAGVPRQIFPIPPGAVLWTNKVTLVADKIAFDALHTRGSDAVREIVDTLEVVAVVEACRETRVAPAIDY